MDNLKYIDENQFLTDLSTGLKNSLVNYKIEESKHIGRKELDLFIENPLTGQTFIIEIKGRPKGNSLPPEIVPWLKDVKNTFDNPKNHFIVLSLAQLNVNVKSLLENSGLEYFEYENHKNNLISDFTNFIKNLESK